MQSVFAYLLLLALSVWTFFQSENLPMPESGIRVSNDYTPETLVRDIFAKGTCDNISNIRSIGSTRGIGYFQNGQSTIGMDQGIIISTGQVADAQGPNQYGDQSGNLGSNDNDPDLKMFATQRLRDVVGIEFDFEPLDSFVQFRYVFASEEYCEFVGSVYNDVFGFFVSGPGIEGEFSRRSKNVALIPETNDYVAINTVNHAYNSEYFIRNELERDSRQCGIEPIVSPHHMNIEYDGFTTILSASLQLIPCETYHIRFVVADVADRNYDSAVFLEAGSFNIGGTVLLSAEGSNGATATEGCSDNYFVFERGETKNLNKPLTVGIKVAEESSAIEGVDFERLPRRVTIPAGQMKVRLPVHFIKDDLAEATEKLTIELDIPCACYQGQATLKIVDPPPLAATLADVSICTNSTVELEATVNGGIPPYTYVWNNGATTKSLRVTANDVGTYSVTVSDQCGNNAADTCQVLPIAAPTATISGYAEICAGDTAFLSVTLSGSSPWQIQYSINGEVQPPLANIETSPFLLPAAKDGAYILESVSDANCEGKTEGYGEIALIKIEIAETVQPVRCFAGNDGSIAVKITQGSQPIALEWLGGLGSNARIDNLSAGSYQLSAVDALGCMALFDIEVPEPSQLMPVVFSCDDLTNANFAFSAGGGTPPYQYAFDGQPFADQTAFRNLEPGKSYDLVIRDANGCTLPQTLHMPPLYEKMVELPPVLELKISDLHQIRPVFNIPEILIDSVHWSPATGLDCTDCLYPNIEAITEGAYTIYVRDIFGCEGEANTQIKLDRSIDVYIPSAFSPNGDQINDHFTIFANMRQVRRVIAFRVFDRWGNLIFSRDDFLPNDPTFGWDGRVRNEPVNAGIFTYFASVELIDGSETLRKGQVSLIR